MYFLSVDLYDKGIDIINPLALYSGQEFSYYQMITHMFLHSDEIHLLFNMIFLFLFGIIVEKSIGSLNFILLYFLSCLGAALLQLMIFTGDQSMIGASGAIFGIVTFSAFVKPSPKISLVFFDFKIKWFVIFLILSEFYSIIFEPSAYVAHWAHIGGALTAMFYYSFTKSIKS